MINYFHRQTTTALYAFTEKYESIKMIHYQKKTKKKRFLSEKNNNNDM